MSETTPKISVIVPVYKVEKYLSRCIDSIIAQTYREFEVILVDDGSPDNCGAICDTYAEKYPYIKVIHQKNQGLSAARNNAVPLSTGEYISFVDSDDFVTPDYLDYLIRLMNKYRADISVGGYIYQYDNREIIPPKPETKSFYYPKEEALSRMNYGKGFSVFAWGKLYKRQLVEAYPYPTGKLYEDLATTYKIVGASNGVAFGNKKIYYWNQRADSIMHNAFNIKQMDGIKAAEEQLLYLQENYPSAVSAGKYRYTAKAVELTGICFSSNGDKSVFHDLKEHISKYAREVLKDPEVKKSMKIRIRASLAGYIPAKIVYRMHEKIKAATIR